MEAILNYFITLVVTCLLVLICWSYWKILLLYWRYN